MSMALCIYIHTQVSLQVSEAGNLSRHCVARFVGITHGFQPWSARKQMDFDANTLANRPVHKFMVLPQ